MSTLDFLNKRENGIEHNNEIRVRKGQSTAEDDNSFPAEDRIDTKQDNVRIFNWISDDKVCTVWEKCTKVLRLRPLVVKTYDQMPAFCRERNIRRGYRPNPASLRYSLTSVFHPTNETLNFWTHFLPFVYLVARHYSFSQKLLFHESSRNVFVFSYWAYTFGCLTMLGVSSLAHLLNCISPRMRHVCYCSDYGAISVYSLGVATSIFYLISPPICQDFIADSSEWYVTLAMTSAIGTHFACCCSRFPRIKGRYTLRSMAFTLLCLVIHYPSVLRLFSELIERTSFCADKNSYATDIYCTSLKAITQQNISANVYCGLGEHSFPLYYPLHLLFLAISGIFNVTRFPEAHFPERFDIIGSSHQFFHVATALACIFQTVYVEDALLDALRRVKTEQMPILFIDSTFQSISQIFIFPILVSILTVVTFSRLLA